MAFHLITRKGGQRIIVSCDVPEKRRQQRIYKVHRSKSVNPKLQLCSTFFAQHRADYLRFRYAKNSTLKPIPEMPACLREMATEMGIQDEDQ